VDVYILAYLFEGSDNFQTTDPRIFAEGSGLAVKMASPKTYYLVVYSQASSASFGSELCSLHSQSPTHYCGKLKSCL